jgi:hypothetical protein
MNIFFEFTSRILEKNNYFYNYIYNHLGLNDYGH